MLSLERGTSAAKEGDAPTADLASHDEVVLGSHKHVKLRRLPSIISGSWVVLVSKNRKDKTLNRAFTVCGHEGGALTSAWRQGLRSLKCSCRPV